ncbi:MAG: hypothetical protein ACTSRP_24225 [Candidatus Helarchaeota archaeon]
MDKNSIGNWIGGIGLFCCLIGYFGTWVDISILTYNSTYNAIQLFYAQNILGISIPYNQLYAFAAIAFISFFGLGNSKLSAYTLLGIGIASLIIDIFLACNLFFISLYIFPNDIFVIQYGPYVSILGCILFIGGSIPKLLSNE